jgi:hypothetical protein
MRMIEILMYEPDDPVEQEHDADTTLMQQLGNAFTRGGVVKALPPFGSVGQQLSGRAPAGPSALASDGGYNYLYRGHSAALRSTQFDPGIVPHDSSTRPLLIK